MNIWAQPQRVGECRRSSVDDVGRDCVSAAKRAAEARHRLEVALEQLGRLDIASRRGSRVACR